MRRQGLWILIAVVAVVVAAVAPASAGGTEKFMDYEWTEVTGDAPWNGGQPGVSPGRAGLEAVRLGNSFYVLGGRSPKQFPFFPGDSAIWGDVWRSDDRGATWTEVLASGEAWPARAYHEAVTKGGRMFVLGGQNFGLSSEFFNDVWSSRDGINWNELTSEAGWEGRAGLSAVVFKGEIYVMGGSFNDDPDIIGGPPTRVLFNDVWKSKNGRDWVQLTDDAPWAPRAGAAVVVKDGYIYLLGGEFGFVGFPPPYFNDVWRTRDGIEWEEVTPSAGWSPRPGHTCDVLRDHIVCFGGFGQSTDAQDPFRPSNPQDVWVSKDGADWTQVSDSPWNAESPADVKYDYDTVVAPAGENGKGLAIYTFGGDRETFDFDDPTQWLNVDNDVWTFSLGERGSTRQR